MLLTVLPGARCTRVFSCGMRCCRHLDSLSRRRQLRVSRQTLHRIMGATHAISPEMAVRLGKFCGNGPDLWLRMQAAYDLWHAEQSLREELEFIPTRAA